MFKLQRNPKTETQQVDLAAVAAGLRAFADHLDAGTGLAREAVEIDEMPTSPQLWAAYPDGHWMP